MASSPETGGAIAAQVKRLLDSLRENIDGLKGNRGDPLDRAITPRDLLDMGLAKRLGGIAQRLIAGANLVASDAPQNMTIPPRPANFTAVGGLAHVHLTWDSARDAFGNYAYTAIYRHTADNLADAVQIAQTSGGFIYSDHDVHYGVTYYYWIRFVSTAEVRGPFNSSVGTSAHLSEDPGELLDRLNGEITATQLHTSLNDRIDLIDAPSTGLVTSVTQIASRLNDVDGSGVSLEARFEADASDINSLYGQYTVKIDVDGFVSGFGLASTSTSSEFLIRASRFAVGSPGLSGRYPFVVDTGTGQVVIDTALIKEASINDAHIGDLDVSKITGDTASFVSANIEDGSITNAKIGDHIQSTSFSAGVSGWKIDKDGTAEFNSVVIREPTIDRTTLVQDGTAYPAGSTYTDVDFNSYRAATIFIDTGYNLTDDIQIDNGVALTGKALVTAFTGSVTGGTPAGGTLLCDLWCSAEVCYGQSYYQNGGVSGPTGGRIYLKVTVDGYRQYGPLQWIRVTTVRWALVRQE